MGQQELTGHQAAVLLALEEKKGHGLTSMDAFRFEPACTRLADVVFRLKKAGITIVSRREYSEDRKHNFSRYWLRVYAPADVR